VIAWAFAASEDAAAPAVVATTRQRTAGQQGVPWVSDGRQVYRREVQRVYRDPLRTARRGRPRLVPTTGVRLTQAVKHRRHGRVVGIAIRPVIGAAPACPYVVYEERFNGVLRDRLGCLTRKTHAFAKDSRTWDALVTMALFEANWLRVHPALRQRGDDLPDGRHYRQRTPAMAMGLTDHLWMWEELLTYRHQQYSRE
jgi:hypothetical protein